MSSRVAPFGNPRINGYLLLPEAFRSLSRPSSAPDAKAFPLRSFQLDHRRRNSLHSVSAFRRKLHIRSFLLLLSPKTRFRRGGGSCGFEPFDLSENSWFSLRIMQAYKDRNCMSPCILSDAVPQSICFAVRFRAAPLCCLTCFVTLFSFQGAGRVPSETPFPTAFAVRFEDPTSRSGLQIQRQIAWWARVGSNHRPYDYQSYALAS